VVIETVSFLTLILGKPDRQIQRSLINRVYLEEPGKAGVQDAFLALLIRSIVPGRRRRSGGRSVLCFEMKDGTVEKVETSIDESKLRRVIELLGRRTT
jgi:hypothetical protein